jgi:hypothetical protein
MYLRYPSLLYIERGVPLSSPIYIESLSLSLSLSPLSLSLLSYIERVSLSLSLSPLSYIDRERYP